MKAGSKLAILLFTLVAIAHLARLLGGMEVTVDEWSVPRWVSVVGIIIPLVIAGMLWAESK